MRIPLLAALVLGSSAALPALQDPEPKGPPEPVVLFDGKSLDGWEGDPKFWRAEDGLLVGESTPENPCKPTTYLRYTGAEFADFEFRCQFRITGGNSGVQFRSKNPKGYALHGYQADIEDGKNWTGCLYEQNGRGVLVRRGQVHRTRAGEKPETYRFEDDAKLLAEFRRGEWNDYRIRAIGGRVDILLNGVRTLALDEGDPAAGARKGLIGLQLHQGPPMKVEYKDLTVVPLDGVAPAALPVSQEQAALDGLERAEGTRWVALPDHPKQTWLRTEFQASKVVRATVHGAGDNHLEVFLNGTSILKNDKWWRPSRAQVDPELFAERNALGMQLRDDDDFGGVWLELSIEFENGESLHLSTNPGWRAATAPAEGWLKPGFEDGGWSAVSDLGGPDAQPWSGFEQMMKDLEDQGPGFTPFDESIEEIYEEDPDSFEDFVVLEESEDSGVPLRPFVADPNDTSPRWIWPGYSNRDGDRAWVRRRFQVPEGATGMRLFGTCDNEVSVRLDGDVVATGDDWQKPFELDVPALSAGTHVLTAEALNTGGPAGLVLQLTALIDGQRVTLVQTDEACEVRDTPPADGWRSFDDAQEGWVAPTLQGTWENSGYGRPEARSNGRAGQADPADSIQVPEGFEIELLYSVPKASQGSWVAICFDERERLIASDQYGKLWRVTVPPLGASGVPPLVEQLDVGIGQAQGLCVAFGSLYVVVAQGEGRGLYRLRDLDRDDTYETVERLTELDGGGEHGPHAVVPDPNGTHLLVIAGNHTSPPPGVTRWRPSQVWEEDQLLPRAPDGGGHAVGVLAPGGWLARVEPDGSNWEVLSIGMRNAYDVAASPSGELFTFDSDMEWDVGLPWYRPTRVLHLVSGSEAGWRHGSGKWPAHYEDSLGAVCDVGLASPTGVVFATDTRFHGDWREALLIGDWTYGKVFAVFLEPDGASFRGRVEPFIEGKPFQVTDMTVGVDGALYLATGGRRTQSGLYRLRSTRAAGPDPVAAAPTPAAALRQRLEAAHGDPIALAELEPSTLVEALADEDRFVRYAARTALEQVPADTWLEDALVDPRPHVVHQAVLAAARLRAAPRERLLEALAGLELPPGDKRHWLTHARAYQLLFTRLGRPTDEVAQELGAQLLRAFDGGPEELNREVFRLLVFLETPGVAEAGLAAMREATSQEEGLFYAFTLRSLKSDWSLELRRSWFHWVDTVAAGFRGGNSVTRYVENMRAEVVEGLSEEERAALGPLLNGQDVAAAPVEAAAPAPFLQAWTRAELEEALRVPLLGRDFERGRNAYAKARCAECHRIAEEGGATGPDLTGAAGRFTLADLLTAIHEPSQAISDQYQDTEVHTADGRVLVGRVVEEDADRFVIQSAPPNGESYEVFTDEVGLRRLHPLSRMPSGLMDVLTADEVRDLFAYVLAGGDSGDRAFR